tara:strand:+ start:968 stop:1717 length:750 start_codon:yes stop_codon:yes gene_type:complete
MSGITTELTHREVKKPRIDIRHLADYMAAQDRHRARNSILKKCRYQKLAQMYHHQEAKAAIRDHFDAGGGDDLSALIVKAQSLRDRIDDSPYERNLYDYNADYLDAFCENYSSKCLPSSDVEPAKLLTPAIIGGVEVPVETHLRFRRLMKGSNRVRIGALMLRYEKGSALPESTGLWQSALLFGYIERHANTGDATPEHKLCVTLDVWTGKAYEAPSDSISRFNEAEAACATIAAAWDKLEPPTGAILV